MKTKGTRIINTNINRSTGSSDGIGSIGSIEGGRQVGSRLEASLTAPFTAPFTASASSLATATKTKPITTTTVTTTANRRNRSAPAGLHQSQASAESGNPLRATRISNSKRRTTSDAMIPIDWINFIVELFAQIVDFMRGLWERFTSKVIELDSGRRVRIGRKIAEGGFSLVFRATDCNSRNLVYALKRIQCAEREVVEACRKEAKVHRMLADDDGSASSSHPASNNANNSSRSISGSSNASHMHNNNVLPLLGMAFVDDFCYMLFPFMPHSLRTEVNRRIFHNHHSRDGNSLPPWSEITVLQIFRGILNGVQAMHRLNISHRDIKLENVLFQSPKDLSTPVLMDFGSTGPLIQPIQQRRDVLCIAEMASSHTTMPYRPPELFDGGVRTGDADVDFAKVDVWSLGCTLFAILYGASPFESEFNRQTGAIRIVDCSQLRVIGNVPFPPDGTGPSKWYSKQIRALVQWMLQQDRTQRPFLPEVIHRVETMLADHNGERHLDMVL